MVLALDPRCPLQDENQIEAVFYPHETDCEKYYACGQASELIELSCQEGLTFDAELNVNYN